MYISLSGEDRVLVLSIDPITGELGLRQSISTPGRPAPLATDPERKFLYVGLRNSCEISTFLIDRTSGKLSLIKTTAVKSDPCYLSTDRNGNFLLSSYLRAGRVAVHSIATDGSVNATPIEWRETAQGAHSIQTDPSNKFAFVPHIAGSVGPNTILQFRFNEGTGELTPNTPPSVTPEEEVGPRHFCFHPKKDILYFSNEQGCNITAYAFDAQSGILEPFHTISTLPSDYCHTNSCAQIQISPSGRFLYAPNRGHNSIACFSVDASTGELISLGQVPTQAIPRAFSLDPQGAFLFAAGLESGSLDSYRILGDTGLLEHLETIPIGKEPMWVLTSELTQ